jgi:thiamine kinase-like enzyme
MDRKELQHKVDQIIQQVPDWEAADQLQIEPLEGLTNSNYAVTVDGERFVLRVSGQNAAPLGINRRHEAEILTCVSDAGIGAQVAYYQLPEGHLVTSYINGRHLSLEAYRTPENIERIVKTVKRLHQLPLVSAVFSPFQRVESYARQAHQMQVPFPHDFQKMLERMRAIEQEQARDRFQWRRFCHNDLFFVNVLDDGNIRFIDWEFSGVNDIYYDLATLTYAYDSLDTLPPELQEHMLRCYFGEVMPENWRRLAGMQYMLMLFTAMWGLLQQGLQNKGHVRSVEGFDFLRYANTTFEAIRQFL